MLSPASANREWWMIRNRIKQKELLTLYWPKAHVVCRFSHHDVPSNFLSAPMTCCSKWGPQYNTEKNAIMKITKIRAETSFPFTFILKFVGRIITLACAPFNQFFFFFFFALISPTYREHTSDKFHIEKLLHGVNESLCQYNITATAIIQPNYHFVGNNAP